MHRSISVGGWLIAVVSSVSLAASSDLRLIEVVKNNDVHAVSHRLKEHADVNEREGDGSTALAWAAYRDNLAIADLLIRAGANASAANEEGATPLHLACMNRSAAMVDRLLAAGANANARLLNGETVLMTCSRTGEPETIKALLAHGAKVNEKETAHDQTALMWAAAERHPEVVRMLLAAGADFRARSLVYTSTVVDEQTQRAGREKLNYEIKRGGMTALMFAARNGGLESAKLLLAAGADVNDTLPDGMSALVLAAHSGNGDVGILLLDKGADPNAAGIGYNALHAAVLRDDVSLVKALLARGADPNSKLVKGTPIRRSNSDYNLPKTVVGATPYLLAAKFAEPDIMEALAAGGADVKATLPDGATALMLATGLGSTRSRRVNRLVEPESAIAEAVTTALRLGADVNAVDSSGNTALHVAAQSSNDALVQLLADHGANLNLKNKRGQTPLAVAMSAGQGRGAAAAAAADPDVTEPEAAKPRHNTAELLRKLGATR
jgi:uncharacterized protein